MFPSQILWLPSIRFPSKKHIGNLAARLSPVAKTDCRTTTDSPTPSICKICIHSLPTHAWKCPKIIKNYCVWLPKIAQFTCSHMIMYRGQSTPHLKRGNRTFRTMISHGGYNPYTKGWTPMETLQSRVQTLNERSNEPSTPYSATSPYFTRRKSLCINPSFRASIVVHRIKAQ